MTQVFETVDWPTIPTGLLVPMAVTGAVVLAVHYVSAWKVFRKAGRPGWWALVPILDAVTYMRIAGLPAWLLVPMLVPGVGWLIALVVAIRLARSFGRGVGFGFGLWVLPVVFEAVLAFDDSTYLGYYAPLVEARQRELLARRHGWDAQPSSARPVAVAPGVVSPPAPPMPALPPMAAVGGDSDTSGGPPRGHQPFGGAAAPAAPSALREELWAVEDATPAVERTPPPMKDRADDDWTPDADPDASGPSRWWDPVRDPDGERDPR